MYTYTHFIFINYIVIMVMIVINPFEGHVALDRNSGPGYDTPLLRLIPAC